MASYRQGTVSDSRSSFKGNLVAAGLKPCWRLPREQSHSESQLPGVPVLGGNGEDRERRGRAVAISSHLPWLTAGLA